MKKLLSALALAATCFGAQAQTAPITYTLGPVLCTDAGACTNVPNDQNANITITIPNKISVNGVEKTYDPGTYSVNYHSVPRSFNSYPVFTYPNATLSFYYHAGRAGSYLHSSGCPSCQVWQLNGGTVTITY